MLPHLQVMSPPSGPLDPASLRTGMLRYRFGAVGGLSGSGPTVAHMAGIDPLTGAALASAAKSATASDPNDNEALRDLASQSGALDPAARAYAQRLAVKQLVRLKIWQPLGMLFGVSREYFDTQFEDEMADRIRDVPEENLVTPRLSVAGPAVQGISFTVEEPELRAMYLNLLAAASDDRSADDAHPSFAEIIRQLAAEEAELLALILPTRVFAMAEIRRHAQPVDQPGPGGYTVLRSHLLPLSQNGRLFHDPRHAAFIDNWRRLGLVQTAYDVSLTNDERYGWVADHPEVMAQREEHDAPDEVRVAVQHGVLTVTDFGRQFWNVVQPDRDDEAAKEVSLEASSSDGSSASN